MCFDPVPARHAGEVDVAGVDVGHAQPIGDVARQRGGQFVLIAGAVLDRVRNEAQLQQVVGSLVAEPSGQTALCSVR